MGHAALPIAMGKTTRAVALGALFLLACGSRPGPISQAKPAKQELSEAPVEAATPRRRTGLWSFLPESTGFVLVLSPSDIGQSPVFSRFRERILDSLPEVEELKARCNIDLLHDLQLVIVAAPSEERVASEALVAIRGNLDRSKVERCIQDLGGTIEGSTWTLDKNVRSTYWMSEHSVLISSHHSSEELAALAKGHGRPPNALTPFLRRIDGGAPVRLAAAPLPASLGVMLGGTGSNPEGMYATVELVDGVHADLGVGFASEDNAQTFVDALRPQLDSALSNPFFAGFVTRLDLRRQHELALLELELSVVQIEQLVALMSGFGPPAPATPAAPTLPTP